MGYSEVCLKRHIIILNWNEKGPDIIDNLHSLDVRDPRQVVIVTEKQVRLDPKRPQNRGVVVMPGDPTDVDVIAMTNAERASRAIVLSADGDVDPDTTSILIALAVKEVAPDLYVVAEVDDPRNLCHFMAAGHAVDEPICADEFVSKMLAQAAAFPLSGVVHLYEHLIG